VGSKTERSVKSYASALARWIVLGAIVGAACGVGSALFLHALEYVTAFRESDERIVYALPLAGLVLGAIYERWGRSIQRGNNLVLDTLHEGSAQIPLRMGPMVLIGTVLTHLFGGSAGREGTAVQMGASFADGLAHRLRLTREARRELLAAGIAGGFGSVFGTPIAGVLFGLEVVTVGRMEYQAIVPALVASLVGDFVTRALWIKHAHYPHIDAWSMTPLLVGKWLLFAVAVALISSAFVELTHRLRAMLEKRIPRLPLRMMVGGIAVIALWKLVGTDRYLGLGVPSILASFDPGGVPPYAFALKLLFTAVTLSAGFLGGEVTPLFFIGAGLGAALSTPLGLPLPLAAGVGLATVFATAANTPIALTVMAIELMGGNVIPHVFVVAVVAYLLSGHRGIYPSQRIVQRKHGGVMLEHAVPLHAIDAATKY